MPVFPAPRFHGTPAWLDPCMCGNGPLSPRTTLHVARCGTAAGHCPWNVRARPKGCGINRVCVCVCVCVVFRRQHGWKSTGTGTGLSLGAFLPADSWGLRCDSGETGPPGKHEHTPPYRRCLTLAGDRRWMHDHLHRIAASVSTTMGEFLGTRPLPARKVLRRRQCI